MTSLAFLNAPRISREAFARVLVVNDSPAAAAAADLYDLIVSYGLDPAIALAFFAHESTYGRYGVAARSLNWGNLRLGPRAYAIIGGFGHYRSWSDSLQDWCELITNRYLRRGLATVEAAIPVYAPSSDGNAPARYIGFVRGLVAQWVAAEQRASGAQHAAPVQRVVSVNGARVRSAPGFGNNVVASKSKGDRVSGVLVEGAEFGGSRQWLKLRDGQYMHSAVLL
jgi:hypothetical protein